MKILEEASEEIRSTRDQHRRPTCPGRMGVDVSSLDGFLEASLDGKQWQGKFEAVLNEIRERTIALVQIQMRFLNGLVSAQGNPDPLMNRQLRGEA